MLCMGEQVAMTNEVSVMGEAWLAVTAGFDLAGQVAEKGNGSDGAFSSVGPPGLSSGCKGQEWMESVLGGTGDPSCASPRKLCA